MSAIFGYIGKNSAKDILLSGLSEFKGAGEDMSGIVLKEKEFFKSFKIKGTPEELFNKIRQLESTSDIGLAQCSREEKCKASSITAPPSSNENFAAVMDGETGNFKSLKKWCGDPFPILTEEDLLLACLCIMNEKNKIELIQKVSSAFSENPSFAFISSEENAIYCKSGKFGLILGTSPDGCFISSELGALMPFCEKYAVLENGETAKIFQDRILVFDSKMRKIKKSFQNIKAQSYAVNNYFQNYELYCCPLAVKEIYNRFVINHQINFDYLKLSARYIDKIDRIILFGQGSSEKIAFSSKSLFETYCGITTIAFQSSEFLYSNTPVDKNTLIIAISQDGENKATLSAVKKAHEFGAKTVAITKNKLSALSGECNLSIITGNEYENNMPASAFISHYLTLCLFSFYLSSKLEIISDLYIGVSLKMAEMLSGITSAAVKNSSKLETAAAMLENSDNIFITSAGSDNSISHEAEQILLDITNKNAKAINSEELSDYPAELLCSGIVFALITDKEHFKSEIKNIYRIKNRGANVIVITSESIEEEIENFENIISFTDSLSVFNVVPCLSCVYKIALMVKEKAQSNNTEQSA